MLQTQTWLQLHSKVQKIDYPSIPRHHSIWNLIPFTHCNTNTSKLNVIVFSIKLLNFVGKLQFKCGGVSVLVHCSDFK